ncbi:MAG TPA: hypothetical protein VG502_00030 [Flexivirga sp.]|uniref:hypothetical protein n=1 Tax=Flexivirga sp. TaxID=1962927 RepID=UPI002CA866E2|nr:hypothetical protein [Flexivirga sp.]HWC20659.1 hypothetical protein [Flexivirga sp.]
MNTKLTDLMARATENLEPVTPDLLERSVAQGHRQRRRRTTLLAATGTGAVLATAGLIAGGIHVLGSPADTAAAGTPIAIAKPSTKPSTTPSKPSSKPTPAGTSKALNAHTLATLKSLVSAPGRTLSSPTTWGESDFTGASYVVDDGHGASFLGVMLSGGGEQNPCVPARSGCKTLPDGSYLYSSKEEPEYTDGRQAQYGVVGNYVTLFRRDGRNINLFSYNAPAEKGKQHTRATPLFSVKDLTALAKSKAWKLPPVSTVKGGK